MCIQYNKSCSILATLQASLHKMQVLSLCTIEASVIAWKFSQKILWIVIMKTDWLYIPVCIDHHYNNKILVTWRWLCKKMDAVIGLVWLLSTNWRKESAFSKFLEVFCLNQKHLQSLKLSRNSTVKRQKLLKGIQTTSTCMVSNAPTFKYDIITLCIYIIFECWCKAFTVKVLMLYIIAIVMNDSEVGVLVMIVMWSKFWNFCFILIFFFLTDINGCHF